MVECPRCGVSIENAGLTSMEPISCTTCGYAIPIHIALKQNPQAQNGLGIVRNYFSDIWKILVHPQSFYRHMPIQGGIAKPFVFALVTHWLGSALSYLWRISLGRSLFSFFQNWFEEDLSKIDYVGKSNEIMVIKEKLIQWFMGVSSVIVDPFYAMASLLCASFLLLIGARIFIYSPDSSGSSRKVTFETSLRILCFGMAASILSVIPLVGGILSSFYAFILTVIGVKEVYRISSNRAFVIALFPKLIVPGIMILGLMMAAFMFIKMIMTSF